MLPNHFLLEFFQEEIKLMECKRLICDPVLYTSVSTEYQNLSAVEALNMETKLLTKIKLS